MTKIGEGIILALDVFQFQSCWLPLNSFYSIMKHFKHREKPKFRFVDWPVFWEGWNEAQEVMERGQSRAPVLLSSGSGTLRSFHGTHTFWGLVTSSALGTEERGGLFPAPRELPGEWSVNELLGSALEKINDSSHFPFLKRREKKFQESVVPHPHPILKAAGKLFLSCLFLSWWLL